MIKSTTGFNPAHTLQKRLEEFMHNNSEAFKMIPPETVHNLFEDLHAYQTELEKRFEKQVKQRTKDLELKIINLKEANDALEAIANKRKEDKEHLENKVVTNVQEMVLKYIAKIKKTELDDQQKVFLDIVESNLNEITSPLSTELSLKYPYLTPTEIQIANLIKQGLPSKKIAEIINISSRTVDAHRKNIRKKIGLESRNINLRSHLLSH
ncbi:MAG: helix-turn-helix transcriptional regulator [Proteobacteria bacterium]|nr:helix-turn-helix transcriptional regulator [Pseudomonadota bacterium]